VPPNPNTEGPEKSLRQGVPGGDIIPAIFGLITLLLLIGAVRNPPASAAFVLVDVILLLSFGVPAYVLYQGARQTGLFATDKTVEYRALGRPRDTWKREEVREIVPMSGGAKLMSTSGTTLREYRFRWWSTPQVEQFARAAGLAAPTALEVAAKASAAEASAADVDPGEAGDGREEQQPG
jgi:hypothetical protein